MAMEDSECLLEQNLLNVFEGALEWIFVGGKGGVGKTTTSCSVALEMASRRHPRKVLLLSTDPAHNLSDAFQQNFKDHPIKVEGVENLYAMEVDPLQFKGVDVPNDTAMGEDTGGAVVDNVNANHGTVDQAKEKDDSVMDAMKDLVGKLPGIEEAMSFAEMMRYIERSDFDCIIFDTAPTGHTLRLLAFPAVLEKGLQKMGEMLGMFGGAISMFDQMMRQQNPNAPKAPDINAIKQKMEDLRKVTCNVVEKLKDPDRTTFVAVLIPEYLALYETERLIQELACHEIDCSNLVINQVLYPENECDHCKFYQSQLKKQQKYIEKIKELYSDLFHLCIVPRQEEDVLGLNALNNMKKKYVAGDQWP